MLPNSDRRASDVSPFVKDGHGLSLHWKLPEDFVTELRTFDYSAPPITAEPPQRRYLSAFAREQLGEADIELRGVLHVPFMDDEAQTLTKFLSDHDFSPADATENFFAPLAKHLRCRSRLDCLHAALDLVCKEDITFASTNVLVQLQPAPKTSAQLPLYRLTGQRQVATSRRSVKDASYMDVKAKHNVCNITGRTSGAVRDFGFTADGRCLAVGSIANNSPEYNQSGNLLVVDFESRRLLTLDHTTTPRPGSTQSTEQQSLHSSVTDVVMCEWDTMLAAGSTDGSVRFYDLATGQPNHRFDEHTGGITRMASSQTHNDIIASADDSGMIYMHYARREGTEMLLAPMKSHVSDICFGKGITSDSIFSCCTRKGGNASLVMQSDVVTGDQVGKLHRLAKVDVAALDVSADGRQLLFGTYNAKDTEGARGDGMLHAIDVNSMTKIRRLHTGHADVNVVSSSPCGIYITSSSIENETAVFDSRYTKAPLGRFPHGPGDAELAHDGVSCLRWLNDGLFATGGIDGCVRFWDPKCATSNALVHVLPNTHGHVFSLEVTHGCRTMAVGYELGFSIFSTDSSLDHLKETGLTMETAEEA